jgi:hypothetical protein
LSSVTRTRVVCIVNCRINDEGKYDHQRRKYTMQTSAFSYLLMKKLITMNIRLVDDKIMHVYTRYEMRLLYQPIFHAHRRHPSVFTGQLGDGSPFAAKNVPKNLGVKVMT